jgi:hypothetical protein
MDKTIDMAREAGAKDWQKMNSDVEYMMSTDALKAFEALVRADEREACAKMFDDRNNGIGFYEPHEPAEIIRARGNT